MARNGCDKRTVKFGARSNVTPSLAQISDQVSADQRKTIRRVLALMKPLTSASRCWATGRQTCGKNPAVLANALIVAECPEVPPPRLLTNSRLKSSVTAAGSQQKPELFKCCCQIELLRSSRTSCIRATTGVRSISAAYPLPGSVTATACEACRRWFRAIGMHAVSKV